jgi:hypothetical protein
LKETRNGCFNVGVELLPDWDAGLGLGTEPEQRSTDNSPDWEPRRDTASPIEGLALSTEFAVQGDVSFLWLSEKPNGKLTRLESRVIHESEKTGHRHEVTEGGVLYRDEAGNVFAYVQIEFTVWCTHQEHRPVHLRHGYHRVGFAQVVDDFEIVGATALTGWSVASRLVTSTD